MYLLLAAAVGCCCQLCCISHWQQQTQLSSLLSSICWQCGWSIGLDSMGLVRHTVDCNGGAGSCEPVLCIALLLAAAYSRHLQSSNSRPATTTISYSTNTMVSRRASHMLPVLCRRSVLSGTGCCTFNVPAKVGYLEVRDCHTVAKQSKVKFQLQ